MFKKFDQSENISNVNVLKSSVQKGIINSLIEQYPNLSSCLEDFFPKKSGVKLVKCHDHIEIYTNAEGDPLFFKQRDGPLCPTLKLLHKYPYILPRQQVDKGAIRFVLSGANIMCPGLTSPGARLCNLAEGSIVAVIAEGKENALAIGQMKMSSEDILSKNKDVGIENIHYLRDGLWFFKQD